MYCCVWAQFITLRRFRRPGRIISSSNRSSCSSPSSSWFQMYFKFSNVPLFFTIVYLVGFKCTSQDFVGRTVVFSVKWKEKQYQMTLTVIVSQFFTLTIFLKRSLSHHSELYFLFTYILDTKVCYKSWKAATVPHQSYQPPTYLVMGEWPLANRV